MPLGIFTICSRNYLAQALTLGSSVNRFHPDASYVIWLVDDLPISIGEKELPYNIQDASTLEIPDYEGMKFRYNVIELSTSLKPFILKKMIESGEYSKVLYLDPDTHLYAQLTPVLDALDQYSIVVTPHFKSLDDKYTGGVPLSEILWVGGYNLGFVGIAATMWGKKIASWWAAMLADGCYADKEDGMHVDQKWIDLLPCLLPRNEFLSIDHLGVNVAFWNLHERTLKFINGDLFIEAAASGAALAKRKDQLILFHFSGFNPNQPDKIHGRHAHYNTDDFPVFKGLFDEYAKNLKKNGYDFYSGLGYGFDHFSNGVYVYDFYRRLARSLKERHGLIFKSYYNSEDESGIFRYLKIKNLLISDRKSQKTGVVGVKILKDSNVKRKIRAVEVALRLIYKVLGIRFYYHFIKVMARYSRMENQVFLISEYKASNNRLWK